MKWAASQNRATCWRRFFTKLLRETLWQDFFFVVVRSFTADCNLLQPTESVYSTPHTSHFLALACAHFNVTSTLAQVWRAAHISLHPIFMRSWCGCSDSLRFSLPLLAVYHLHYRLVHSSGLQHLLPWCGGQVPCALSLVRTSAPLPSTTLSHKKTQCKGRNYSTKKRKIPFSSRRWTNKICWRRSGTENIHLDTASTNSRRE